MMGIISVSFVRNVLIFKNLLYRDFTILKKDFLGDVINIITWPCSLAISFGYILPMFGMTQSYGSFLLVGALGTTYFYLAIGFATALVSDLESMRFIESQLVLPLTSYRVLLAQRVTTFALHSVILTIPLLPIGKLLLADRLNMVNFSLAKFMLIMIMSGIFFGTFAIWLAAWIPNNRSLANVWRRVYTPMQLLGCYWFSFYMANKVLPWLSYCTLLTPLTYISEGVRSAVFGPAEYLNYWLCLLILFLYTAAMAAYAMYRLKLRLDLL